MRHFSTYFRPSLEYSTSFRILATYFANNEAPMETDFETDEPAQPTATIAMNSGSDDPDQRSVMSAASKQTMHERWQSYRTKRRVLEGALRYYLDRTGKDDVQKTHPAIELRTVLDQIDGALRRPIPTKVGSDWIAETVIDKLADASYRVDQARKVEALVPPVIDVDRDYLDATTKSRQGDRPGSKPVESVDSILTTLPWLYQISLVGWTLLAWAVAGRIMLDNGLCGTRPSRPALFDFRDGAVGAKRLFTHLLIFTLVIVISLICRPLLAIVPSARSHVFLSFLVISLPVALPLFTPVTPGRTLRLFIGVLVAASLLVAWAVLLLVEVDFAVRAMVAAAAVTLLMLVALQGWIALAPGLSRSAGGTLGRLTAYIARLGWAAVVAAVAWIYWGPYGGKPAPTELFAATRLPFLNSGVSPLPTGMYLGALFVFWCVNRLGQIRSSLRLPSRHDIDSPTMQSLSRNPAEGAMWAREMKSASEEFESLGLAMREWATPTLTVAGFRAVVRRADGRSGSDGPIRDRFRGRDPRVPKVDLGPVYPHAGRSAVRRDAPVRHLRLSDPLPGRILPPPTGLAEAPSLAPYPRLAAVPGGDQAAAGTGLRGIRQVRRSGMGARRSQKTARYGGLRYGLPANSLGG